LIIKVQPSEKATTNQQKNRKPIRRSMRARPALSAGASASARSACVRISAAGLRRPQQEQQQKQQRQRRRRGRQGARASATAPGDGGDPGPGPSSSGDDALARLLKADVERFSSAAAAASSAQSTRQKGAGGSSNSGSGGGGANSAPQEQEGGVKAALDKLLVADFFAVLAALGWLGAGLAERAALGSSRLVDAWMPLWPLLWQPLIGVLMAGALVSGGAGWVAGKAREREEEQEQARQKRR